VKLVHESGQIHRLVRAGSLLRTVYGSFPMTALHAPVSSQPIGSHHSGRLSCRYRQHRDPPQHDSKELASDGSPPVATIFGFRDLRRHSPSPASEKAAQRGSTRTISERFIYHTAGTPPTVKLRALPEDRAQALEIPRVAIYPAIQSLFPRAPAADAIVWGNNDKFFPADRSASVQARLARSGVSFDRHGPFCLGGQGR
jgi:hypothetical protein